MVKRVAIRIDVGSGAPLDLVSKLIQDVSTVCNTAVALDRQSELNRATRLLPLDDPARIELAEYLQTGGARPFGGNAGDYLDDDKLFRYPGRIRRILDYLLLSSAVFGPPGGQPPAEAQAAYLLDAVPDSGPLVPTVERISYSNPLEIVLEGFTWGHLAVGGVTGGSLFALLNFIGYVGPKRDKLKAEATKTKAEARKLDAEAEEAQARALHIRTAAECKAEVTRVLLRRVQDGDAVLTPQQISDIVDDQAIGAVLELAKRPLEIEDQSDKAG
ncbi:hypothetical protein B7435_24735 [Mycolicibacterium peregrinum]|uniref:hypothetical protein n=1 Tax=Mycolicibacterium peregrinum TaxID=43304 RepID=UPI0006D77BAA|nr:hypothetical protein [Mycolicibacterium peregrinum]MCV7205157.1 hypothetical protein [Mycolicibacterium peregrinum]ORW54917.1 hypothetical protein AWC21_24705 [Mycolicibacterium peregrinum]OWL98496.1 hypothetical protein B7435_24735 [Mycolicibacterium peregrinum]